MLSFDHFILGVDDLNEAMTSFNMLTGVLPVYGGGHPTLGTHNALVSLGNGSYFELLSIDPVNVTGSNSTIESLKSHKLPKLIGWALEIVDLEKTAQALISADLSMSPLQKGSRKTPEGVVLNYEFAAIVGLSNTKNIVPFFIKWVETAHPSQTSPIGCHLQDVALGVSADEKLITFLKNTGLAITITETDQPFLEIRFRSPLGEITFK